MARFEWLRQTCEQLPGVMEAFQWDLYLFLRHDAIRRFHGGGMRRPLVDKELSVLSWIELNVATRRAAEGQRKILELGRIYERYRALDQDIRSLLSDADQILKSVSHLVSAGTYTKAKSAVVRLKWQASSFENDIKELLKVVSMDAGQALRRLNEVSPRR